MRRLIRQYEEKNKIIQEIEKNLRMGYSKSPRQEKKSKERLTSLSFHLDLPTINVRHQYTPKSHNSSQQKKQEKCAALPVNEIGEQKSAKRQNKAWIQTISFKSDADSETKTLLLINHRNTMRNFMKLTSRNYSNPHDQNSQQKNKEIFLSTSKYSLVNKEELDKIKKKQQKKLQMRSLETDKKKQIRKKEQKEIQEKYQQKELKEDHTKAVLEQIMSNQMSRKQRQIGMEPEQINLSTINTMSVSTNRYRRQRKKTNRNKRSYSPWNSQNESAQITEIWNAYN